MESDVALVESIPCAVLLYSDDGAILAANELFCGMLGYAPTELTRLHLADVAQLPAAEQDFRAANGDLVRCEVAIKQLGGGKNLAVVRKLRANPSHELVLHAIDEGFVLLDRDFRIRLINDEALRIDGRQRSQLIGLTHWEAWPGSEQLPLAESYRKAMRDRKPSSVEQIYHRDGYEVWYEARAFPYGDGLALLFRNITERKLAERAIRDSEEKFRTIADAIPQIVWSTRPDGFHDYFNHQWYEVTGVPEDAVLGEGWMGLFHPDAVPDMQERWSRSLATGEPYEAEFRLRHRSGEYRWTLGRAMPMRDADGNIVRWMGTSTDIHELFQMRAKLHDTQSRLDAALTAAQIGTWTWEIQADRVHADRNLVAMFGIAPERADSSPMADYFDALHPDDVDTVRESLERSVKSGEPYHEDFRLRIGGGIRFVQARGVVATDAEGNPLRMSGVVLDVTRQQLAEDALKSSELTFRTLADNIPQLAWMADSQGSIFWYNNRWFEYTGTTMDEMKGWGWAKVHHPGHVERVVALYQKQIVEEQRVWDDTFPLRGADGRYRWFLSRAVPIRDADGNVLRWLGTNTDITLQREAEEALHQANQRKDDFLALLAHELRNPLAPISAAAQLLKQGASNPESLRRSSEIIDRQVRHLSDLVNDLVDVSRVTRGLVSIGIAEVAIADVVHRALEQAGPLIDARGQHLVLDLEDEQVTVLGDRTRLVQVLVNLLTNAAKYTPQGGRIELSVAVRDEQVEIGVDDNGIGMDAELLPHVFELFTQAERTPDRSEGGLGLGLALVKSIVALHGGRVSASSAGRGRGSRFTVSLPLPQPPEEEARALHILLVDRAEDGDAALPAALEAEGHTVELCPDEPTALERARDLHPDAVLIRTDLPGVEGYALARRLRALHPEEHATYIALSDSGQSHDKVIAHSAGFDHLLERPVAIGSLRRFLPMARH